MASVEFKAVSKSFGSHIIVPKLDLSIASGEFVALVGPSGCGKSTTLRMLAGLEEPSGGRIFIDGRDVTDVSPKNRGVAMVFQSYALYPHMTVAANLAFPLKMAGTSRAESEKKVAEVAEMLDLTPLLERKPAQLSGGQKQRVAMGRALTRNPSVLLFDEPLSNLDAQLRVRVRSEIAALHKRLKSTIVYVTHDQVEAMTLADRIAILNQGILEQLGTPLEVYGQPRSRFVASFIGTPPMNFVSAGSSGLSTLPAGATLVGFRPEITSIEAQVSDGYVSLARGRVSLVEPLGGTTQIHIQLENQPPTGMTSDHRESVVAELRGHQPRRLGEELVVHARRDSLFFFGSDGLRLEAR